jgi:hypothetical protein
MRAGPLIQRCLDARGGYHLLLAKPVDDELNCFPCGHGFSPLLTILGQFQRKYAGGVSYIRRWQAPQARRHRTPIPSGHAPRMGCRSVLRDQCRGRECDGDSPRWRRAFGACHRLMSITPPACGSDVYPPRLDTPEDRQHPIGT